MGYSALAILGLNLGIARIITVQTKNTTTMELIE
jgi:hypothetical protein